MSSEGKTTINLRTITNRDDNFLSSSGQETINLRNNPFINVICSAVCTNIFYVARPVRRVDIVDLRNKSVRLSKCVIICFVVMGGKVYRCAVDHLLFLKERDPNKDNKAEYSFTVNINFEDENGKEHHVMIEDCSESPRSPNVSASFEFEGADSNNQQIGKYFFYDGYPNVPKDPSQVLDCVFATEVCRALLNKIKDGDQLFCVDDMVKREKLIDYPGLITFLKEADGIRYNFGKVSLMHLITYDPKHYPGDPTYDPNENYIIPFPKVRKLRFIAKAALLFYCL